MDTEKDFLRTFLGIPVAIVALCMGYGFWFYFSNGFFIVIPFMIGYIYIVANLVKLKRWALENLYISILAALLMEVLFILLGRVREGLFEWFFILFVIMSSVVMTVFGIPALIRMLMRKKE